MSSFSIEGVRYCFYFNENAVCKEIDKDTFHLKDISSEMPTSACNHFGSLFTCYAVFLCNITQDIIKLTFPSSIEDEVSFSREPVLAASELILLFR